MLFSSVFPAYFRLQFVKENLNVVGGAFLKSKLQSTTAYPYIGEAKTRIMAELWMITAMACIGMRNESCISADIPTRILAAAHLRLPMQMKRPDARVTVQSFSHTGNCHHGPTQRLVEYG